MKAKGGTAYGDPLEMVGPEKIRRVAQAAESLARRASGLAGLEVRLEAVGIRDGRFQRVALVL